MKPKTKSELMAEWANQPDQLKKEREAKAVRKALEEAERLGCKTVAEYNQLCPIGGSRAKGTRVDRAQPSGNDILSPEFMARSRERLRKSKKGADDHWQILAAKTAPPVILPVTTTVRSLPLGAKNTPKRRTIPGR